MARRSRSAFEFQISIANGQTESDVIDLGPGAFGTFIVPTGSALIGKELQILAVSRFAPARFAPVPLFSTPITLAAGANAMSTDQIREAGCVSRCRVKVNSAVDADSVLAFLYKA